MKEKELLNQMQQLIKTYDIINNQKTTITFLEALDKWLKYKSNILEPNTIDNYKLTINKHLIPFFKNKNISSINKEDIENYIETKKSEGLSNNTINHHLSYMSSLFNYCCKNNLVNYNVLQLIEKLSKDKYVPSFLSTSNALKFCSIFKDDIIELCVMSAIFLGLRRSEVLGLKWSCIDWNNKTIHINCTLVTTSKGCIVKNNTKSKSSKRTLYIPDVLFFKFKQRYAEVLYYKHKYKIAYNNKYIDFIFTHKNGNIILPDYLSRRFKNIQLQNDLIPIRFHDLRHSCGVILHELGYSLADISKWLGHSSISITSDIYVHLSDERKRNIANSINDLCS